MAQELIQTSIALGDPEPWKTWIPYTALLHDRKDCKDWILFLQNLLAR